MNDLRITHRDPKTLTPHPRNARRHSDKQKQQLAQSITALGFNVAVLVDASGQILAGHCRTQVAIELGLTSIPMVCIEHLSEGQARAFMIAENRIGDLSDFDEGLLALELEEILTLDEPFEITTGEIHPRLADAHNHVIDALRFAMEGAHRTPTGFGIRTAGRRTFAFARPLSDHDLWQQMLHTGGGWGSVPSRRRGVMS